MRTRGGVVNIGSIHARTTKPGFVSYATSKAALIGLTQALAVDLGSKGVRVNVVQPAATQTDMLMRGLDGHPEAYDRLAAYHPLERIADPGEIADAVMFLVSANASFITGAVLSVDGGIGVRLHDPK